MKKTRVCDECLKETVISSGVFDSPEDFYLCDEDCFFLCNECAAKLAVRGKKEMIARIKLSEELNK